MASKTTFNETAAIELYHAHKTDAEIAQGAGSLPATIKGWRNRRGMPNISPGARKAKNGKVNQACGIDYRRVLSPYQSLEMDHFLSTLVWASDRAAEAGVKPNVESFMKSWIGMPVSEEGRKQRIADRKRESYYSEKAGRKQNG